MRYMFAVGPPRSEITPVKPGTLSRIRFDLANDRLFGTVLDDAAFVLGDRAKGAAAEAAAHDVDRETDHLVGRESSPSPYAGCGTPGVGHAEHVVHFFGGQRNRRRVEPHVHLAVVLHQSTRVAWVGFQVQDAVGVGVEHRVTADFFHRRQADHGFATGHARRGQDRHELESSGSSAPGRLARSGASHWVSSGYSRTG